MGDLGDLTNFMKDGSVADLSWLEVDPVKYRRETVLPKQNLDIQPDLQALWAHEDKPSTTYLVPNVVPVPPFKGSGEPHTMGDMSQAHGPLRSRGEDLLGEEIRKMARMALMQSSDPARLRDALVKRYDLGTLQTYRPVIAEVIRERGLLGKLYIAASDFNCEVGHKLSGQFARRYAHDAMYVVAKEACHGCCHAKSSPMGGQSCAVFHKEIVLDVPYTEALADAVEQSQMSKGKEVQATRTAPPRERIRLAMLASDGGRPAASGPYQGQGAAYIRVPVTVAPEQAQAQLIAAGNLTKKTHGDALRARKTAAITEVLRREMLKGLAAAEVVRALKFSFSTRDLQETRLDWEPLFKEAGLYGHVYSTQDSFEECTTGAGFLAKHNAGIRAIVAGNKCDTCIYHKVGRCMVYGKPVVASAEALYTPETVEAVLLENKTAGRLPPWDGKVASTWGNTPREQLKAIHHALVRDGSVVPAAPGRMDLLKAFHGTIRQPQYDPLRRPEVIAARKLLNEGLYGQKLALALRLKFEPAVLIAAQKQLRPVLAEQGLQGIFYVDPSVYDDYGAGCDEAQRLHRGRGIKYAKFGPKCAGCVLQTQPGYCSKLNKELVFEPPYVDKAAQQRAILASGSATETEPADLFMRSNIVAEYEMQHGGMVVDVDPPKQARLPMPIEFNNRKIIL